MQIIAINMFYDLYLKNSIDNSEKSNESTFIIKIFHNYENKLKFQNLKSVVLEIE